MDNTNLIFNNDEYEAVALLKELTCCKGVSSDEDVISDLILRKIENFCDDCYKDKYGNIIGKISSELCTDKTIMLEAHLDRIGLMVSKINDDGTINFVAVGGIDERVLPCSEVCIFGKSNIYGVVCTIDHQENESLNSDKMYIDTGLDFKNIEKLVDIGDLIIINSEFTKLCGYQYSCGAMDNRAGITTLLQTLYKISKKELKYNLIVLFSAQEELGLHGAYNVSNYIDCNLAIIIDVTHGTTPDTKNEIGVFDLGCGAVICRGPNLSYDYSRQLIKLAESMCISHTIEVAAGSSGTTAWALQIAGEGIPTTLISIPLKYMHTNVETIDIRDIKTVSKLLLAILTGGIYID